MDVDEDFDYREEWEALQVTYPELNLPNEPPHKGTSFSLQIQVDLNRDYILKVLGDTGDHAHSEESIQISYLPPIHMNLLLPPSYPHEQPPQIISLSSMHDWLPEQVLKKLAEDLREIWNRERCIILALWLDHIRDGEELLKSLGFLSEDTIQLDSHGPTVNRNDLARALQEYDRTAKDTQFNSTKHRCPVCFESVQGVECVSLTYCEHVACKGCLKDGWSLYISEGRSELVGCPDPQCVKSKRLASMEDVQTVLSPEEIARWLWLIRKKETEKDPTIVFCPHVSCQKPVKKEPPLEGRSSEWERLRTCECGFTFCVYCRRTWHGPHLPCPLPASAEFVRKYAELPQGSPEKQALEIRYGISNLAKLVAKYREDQLNRAWLERETMICPGCQVRVQKNTGCNHMTCAKCGQHFCYRCGSKIRASDPYMHFSTKGQPCYSKLFDGAHQDDGIWIDMGNFE